ncbi:DUF1636 domain-containing protein [Roseibium sp. Sym1]|uniref:DUF1636 domain-containing protein n=1 Tax=Roseibium sp. Sym1 TaxID=3016006 RepID=UPI0022B579A5|nr:DUF1636 domain-containing protein [Roseibium sp. Sym1]
MSAETQRIFVCTVCPHKGGSCGPGYDLLRKLQDAVKLTVPVVGDDFEISGTACIAGCLRPCMLAFRAGGKSTYLFGDVAPETDIDDLIAFADLYREREEGRGQAADGQGPVGQTDLTRIPAAMIVTQVDPAALS